MNNTSECTLWIKKVGTVFTLTLAVTSQTTNTIIWNGDSNVVYNRITDIQYEDGHIIKEQIYSCIEI